MTTSVNDDYERASALAQSANSSLQAGQNSLQGEEVVAQDMTWLESMWLVCKRSTPTIMTMIFFQMVQLVNIFYVGHMSSELLAGVGLGNMLLNVFVFAVTMGLNGTIETFVSWEFGKDNKRMCGVHLNRARIIVSCILVPVVLIFLFVDNILVALKQDPTIARDARNYCVWTIPGWFSLVQFDCTKRFLQTIHKSVISTTTQCVTTVIHFAWGYLFIVHLDMGVAGAAIALNLTYCVNYMAQEFYIKCIDWAFFKDFMEPVFQRSSFNWAGAKEFLKLGVPGTMMQCAEWWAFELLAIFAGILGSHQLAAQVAVINIIGLLFMFPLGVQFVTSANVGGQIGAGNTAMAKKHAKTHVVYALILISIVMVFISIFEDNVAGLFTEDPEDQYYISEVLNLIYIYLFLDTIHGVNTGIVRALGKQFRASVATFICYYFIGMPMALWLGFKQEMGVVGFWLGFTCALAMQDIIVTIIIVTADWESIAQEKTDTSLNTNANEEALLTITSKSYDLDEDKKQTPLNKSDGYN